MDITMRMDDLEMLAKIVWKRKNQKLDRTINDLEQEKYRLFFWLMQMMEEQLEREYPPVGRVVRHFVVEKHGERSLHVSTTGINKVFCTIPTVDADKFIPKVAEIVNFIEQLEGYEIMNRFPKDTRTDIKEFLLILDYRKKQS